MKISSEFNAASLSDLQGVQRDECKKYRSKN